MFGKQVKSSGRSDDLEQISISSSSSASNAREFSGAASGVSILIGDTMSHIGEFLTPQEEARFGAAKAAFRAQSILPTFTTFFTPPQRTANYFVLTGMPEYLLRMLEKDPMMFFKKHEQIKDAAGQVFYDVSPADLISFICDDDMQMQVNTFAHGLPPNVRAAFFAKWQEHFASIGRGGADLVMVTGEQAPQYAGICVVNTPIVTFSDITTQRLLLKNPDGVICWKSPNNQLHWYYANHETQTLEPIDIPSALLETLQEEYNEFATRMMNMEPMTAKRSSNQEHTIIKSIMRHNKSHKPIRLHREGIHYKNQDGIDYVDTRYDFNRIINAYLKCIRLYDNNIYSDGDRVFRGTLGHVQREVMWLIQRYCERNRLFLPLADNYKDTIFIRTQVEINNNTSGDMERIFDAKTGEFISGFGLDDDDFGFGICKGRDNTAYGRSSLFLCGADGLMICDFVAASRLWTDAIQSMEDFRTEISTSASPGSSVLQQCRTKN